MATSYAFVTLLTSDEYLPGALALAAALHDVHPSPPVHPEVEFQTACLITPETIDVSTIKLLRRAFDIVIGVELITQRDAHLNLQLLGRPDLNTVLTKLHVFRLTQFSKIIFLDADVLPIHPISHLFTLPHEFSAVTDVGWPDIFNSGVMVLTPGEDKFNSLHNMLQAKGTWDGGDQGILNEWRGGDWNRISFTYNTTPTAIYSYAPAYERFGSQINAIHFVGANKPWHSLLYRAAGSSSADNRDDRPQQAYDYDSLVDKWYAVFDKHYRSQPVAPATSFEVKRYTSVWDEDTGHDLAIPSTVQSGAPLGLADLRRITEEGISTAGILGIPADERQPGEGEYKSLPLEGRVDLMRPRHEEENKERSPTASPLPKPAAPVLGGVQENIILGGESLDLPSTPTARVSWHISLPEDGSPVRMYTLPTPAPYEIPATPHLRALSLPPSMPPTPSPLSHFQGPQTTGMSTQQPSPSPLVPPGPEETPTYISEEIHRCLESLDHEALPHEQQQPYPEPQHQDQQHSQDHRENPRPASPPLIAWNPAKEPPPTIAPPPSAFPSDTYFPNVWDQSLNNDRPHQHEAHPWSAPPPDSIAFFEEPPTSGIPEPLVRQGHYTKVTGEQESGATPSPDRTKVKRIFPWEEKPRQLPGRQFPASEVPAPGAFLEPRSPSPVGLLGTPERQITRGPIPSPLSGLPSTLNYANAWDSVRGIQRYASRLMRPSPPALLAPAFEVGRRRRGDTFRSWTERTEISSRDGDDEDNADESEGENLSQSPRWTNDSGSEEGTYRRRGSISPSSIKARAKYMSVGVQTIEREMTSQGVQVSIGSYLPSSTFPQDRSRLIPNGKPPILHTSPGMSSTLATGFDLEPEPTSTQATKATMPSSRVSLPSGMRSPVFPLPGAPAHTVTPPRSILPSAPVSSSTRTLTSPSLASPESSIGPLSTPEGIPVRKGGRVWDPARGVDLLRRGSEEVLARFLKMGSWEEDGATVQGAQL